MARRDANERGDETFSTEQVWLPSGDATVGATWFRPTASVAGSAGVVLVPSIIHEEQTMALGLVALARDLAAHGTPALLIDLAGTAQGSGSLADPNIGQRWDEDVRSAVHHLRACGLEHVAVVGVRLGALLAAHALAHDPVDLLVLWAPVLSGRRFTRELQMMQAAASDIVAADPLPGITVAGYNVPPSLVSYLKGLDAAKLDGKPAGRLCLVDSVERLRSVDADHPLLASVPLDRLAADDTEPWLFTAADDYAAPFESIPRVRRKVASVLREMVATHDASARPSAIGTSASGDLDAGRSQVFEHNGVQIRETFVTLGPIDGGGHLRGVLSEPVEAVDGGHAFVAVTTVGPGRIFVDFARREAARGRTCLRFELAGFGASSHRPHGAWADYYHPTAQRDLETAVDHVVGLGFPAVTIIGFCAGAWTAFQMPPRPEVTGIVAVNVQLQIRTRFLHRRTWPTLSRREALLATVSQHPQVQRVLQRVERDNPVPSPAVRWLRRHLHAGTDVTLMFAEGDLGEGYFRARGHRLFGLSHRGPQPDVRVYAGLGHLPSGEARVAMLDDIHDLAN